MQIRDGFERHIRVDRAGSVTNEQAEMMHFARFTGFYHKTRLRAGAFANKGVMHGGSCEQAGDGGLVGIHATVGENENAGPVANGLRGIVTQLVKRLLHPVCAVGGNKQHGQRC